MSKTPETKSNTPILIIGAVLVIALLGGWYLFSSAKQATTANTPKANNGNTASTPKPNTVPTNAPQGAVPPNQSGSATAMVTIEEFADFQCPQCAATHPIMNEIKSTYGSRIHFIYRDFPLDIPAHDKSYEASVAAEAAGMQGKFWDMQNILFTNQKAWTADPTYKQIWKDYAQKISLDLPKWENDMAGIAAKTRVDEDKKRGNALNVHSTPTIFINNVEIPFAQVNVAGLKQLIDAELQKTAPQPTNAAPAGNTYK